MNTGRYFLYLFLSLGLLLWSACHTQTGKDKSADNNSVTLEPLPPLPAIDNFQPQVQEKLRLAYDRLKNQEGSAQMLGEASQLFHAHHLEIVAAPGYQRAIQAAPEDFRWYYLSGVAAKAVGHDDTARAAFTKAKELAPEHGPSAIEWGEFEIQHGRFNAAKEVFEGLLAKDPNHVMALYGLGQVALAQGQHQQAETYLLRVLELDPGATIVYYPLSQAQARQGKPEAAQASLSKRGEGKPTMPDELMEQVASLEMTVLGFRRSGDRALMAGDNDTALIWYGQALDLDREDPATYLNRGWAYFYSQNGQAAAQDWQKVLQLTDKPLLLAQAHHNLAQLSLAIGKPKEAIAGYEKALELYPEYQRAKLALADVLRASGQFEQALKYYQVLVKDYPGDPVARLGRSLCLIRTDAYAQAIQALQEDVAAQSQQAAFYHMLIRLLAAAPVDGLRNGPEAFGMMIRLTNDWQVLDSGLAETAAMILAELGRFDEAIRMQQRALSMASKEGADDHLKQRLLANLENYAQKIACREPWPDDAPIFTRPSLGPEPALSEESP